MLHSCFPAVYTSFLMVAVAADGVRHAQLHRLSSVQSDGIPPIIGEESTSIVWNNWSRTNLPLPNVQDGLLRSNLPRIITVIPPHILFAIIPTTASTTTLQQVDP